MTINSKKDHAQIWRWIPTPRSTSRMLAWVSGSDVIHRIVPSYIGRNSFGSARCGVKRAKRETGRGVSPPSKPAGSEACDGWVCLNTRQFDALHRTDDCIAEAKQLSNFLDLQLFLRGDSRIHCLALEPSYATARCSMYKVTASCTP